MEEAQLIVGTSSTWSIRAWLCLKLAGVKFTEKVVVLEKPDHKKMLSDCSPTGLVPVLKIDELCIHDSLAIAEFTDEIGRRRIFPVLSHERALARSYCAELHSGFLNLRSACPFSLHSKSHVVITEAIQSELTRITTIWSAANGDFYFEKPGMIDAFYAVLAYRLHMYGIQLPERAGEYQQALLKWPLLKVALLQAKNWSE